MDDCGFCDDNAENNCLQFNPEVEIIFDTPYIDSLTSAIVTISQSNLEPEAFSSLLTTIGGNFEFYDLTVGDTIGSGMINFNAGIHVDYHMEVLEIISSVELHAVLVLDSDFDDLGGWKEAKIVVVPFW